jgi:hypothetical protein
MRTTASSIGSGDATCPRVHTAAGTAAEGDDDTEIDNRPGSFLKRSVHARTPPAPPRAGAESLLEPQGVGKDDLPTATAGCIVERLSANRVEF